MTFVLISMIVSVFIDNDWYPPLFSLLSRDRPLSSLPCLLSCDRCLFVAGASLPADRSLFSLSRITPAALASLWNASTTFFASSSFNSGKITSSIHEDFSGRLKLAAERITNYKRNCDLCSVLGERLTRRDVVYTHEKAKHVLIYCTETVHISLRARKRPDMGGHNHWNTMYILM